MSHRHEEGSLLRTSAYLHSTSCLLDAQRLCTRSDETRQFDTWELRKRRQRRTPHSSDTLCTNLEKSMQEERKAGAARRCHTYVQMSKGYLRGEKNWYRTECHERKYVTIDIFTQETRVSSGSINAGERQVMYGEAEVNTTSRVPASQTGQRGSALAVICKSPRAL